MRRPRFFALATTVLSVLAGTPNFAQEAGAKDPAPAVTRTVAVAAHASRWDYPKEVEVPADGELRLVVKGDTLWDLSAKTLGDPFAWPQIWELNKWVKDPHWIYPGDPILIDLSRKVVAKGDASNLVPPEVADLRPDAAKPPRRTRDELAFAFQDFISMPFLVRLGMDAYVKEVGALRVVGHQDAARNMLGDGDVVYLDGGSDRGFRVGDRLVAFRLQTKGLRPAEDAPQKKAIGDVIQQVGILRLTQVLDTRCIAMIERTQAGIRQGDRATPFAYPADLVAKPRTDTADPVQAKDPLAKVVFINDGRVIAGAGDMVILDHGSEAGLAVGDTLLAIRRVPLGPEGGANAAFTNVYMGQAVVVRADPGTATCRFLRTREEIQVGTILTR
jgi:hypothetical protein